MGIDFDNIEGMNFHELLKLLDSKRIQADLKRDEIKKLRSAIESTKTNKTYTFEEVSVDSNEKDSFDLDDDFDKEVDYYLSDFLGLKDYSKESILDVLPSRNNYNYEKILLRIIAEITHDIKDIKEIIVTDSDNMDKDELNEYKDEMLLLINKRDILKDILVNEEIDGNDIVKKENKLIFVPVKGSDKVRALEEVKDIPQENYEGFLDLLKSIKDGSFKRIRRFVNNEGLNGALEVKGYQVRVLFQRLSSDCYAIITMFIKKSQNDRGYRNTLQIRYSEYKDLEKDLKEKIKDPKFIQKNKEIEKELFTMLEKIEEDSKGGSK